MAAEYIEVENDIDKAFKAAYDQGWTDGLPIIPPTDERVAAMLATVDRKPGDVIGLLPPRNGQAIVEKVAVSAVMAGCLPSYFPVVVAAIEAAADPAYYLRGVNSTTNPVAPLIIVNGPIRNEIGINCSWSVMGPGPRANATIGRAFSLCMINIAGRIPGEVTKSTHAAPGRYSWCIGEYEEKSPWEPLHVERGFKREESAVTLLAPTGHINALDMLGQTGDEILTMVASCLSLMASNNFFNRYGEGDMGVILCPAHAEVIARDLKTKQAAKEALLEKTSRWIRMADIPPHLKAAVEGLNPGSKQIEGEFARLAARADQFVLVVAGGLGGYHSVALPTFGGPQTITRVIKAKKR